MGDTLRSYEHALLPPPRAYVGASANRTRSANNWAAVNQMAILDITHH